MTDDDTRRTFLKTAAASTAGGLLAGLPQGWAGSVYADDSPGNRGRCASASSRSPTARRSSWRTSSATSRSSASTRSISKEASWAVIRDKLSLGENQATHMLIGMPLASTMGLAGSPVKPMVIPWLLNRNGQAITLNNKLKQAGVEDAAGAQAARRQGEGRRRAADVRDDVPAGHARDVDALLAGVGRHPSGQGRQPHHHPAGADGRQHEGRQDGRLLRRRAVEQPRHRRRHRLHRRSRRSRCGRTIRKRSARSPRSSPTKNPKTVKAVLKALHLASVHLDKLDNRAEGRGGHRAADLHQLPAGDHPRAAARQVRLRRRPDGAGPELHDLLGARLQLPAARSSASGG